MNKQRRNDINKAIDLLEKASAILDQVRDEEQEAFDNMPENLQESDKGQAMQQSLDDLDAAIECIGDAISSANDAAE
jgi:hypothetical protein